MDRDILLNEFEHMLAREGLIRPIEEVAVAEPAQEEPVAELPVEPVVEPEVEIRFRRGYRVTGQHPVAQVEPEAAAEPPAKRQPPTKPEESFIVRPDQVQTFGDLMAEGEPEGEPWSWEKLPTGHKLAYGGTALLALVAVVVLIGWFVNLASGGRQYAARPTSAVAAAGPGAPASALDAPSAAAQPTAAPAATSCNGYQFYHSPDVSDVGPCVPKDAAVVPTGKYGDEGIWLFMILPDGSSKWVKAANYGYTPAQVNAMQLKDFKPKPSAAPQQPAAPAQPSGGAPVAADNTSANPNGPPAPAPTSAPEPTRDVTSEGHSVAGAVGGAAPQATEAVPYYVQTPGPGILDKILPPATKAPDYGSNPRGTATESKSATKDFRGHSVAGSVPYYVSP